MSDRNFRDMLKKKWGEKKFVCVGLDSDAERLPEPLRMRYTEYSPTTPINQTALFRKAIVRATADTVAAYKLHPAYLNERSLDNTIDHIHGVAPTVPIIVDGKYGDGSRHANEKLAEYVFDFLKADAVTVNPFVGQEALLPFLERKDNGVFVLCHTSNTCAGEFQDAWVRTGSTAVDKFYRPLYQMVACNVAAQWNENGNCGLVVGATYPGELHEIRGITGDMPILVTGFGPQQPDVPLEEQVQRVVVAGIYGSDLRMLLNSSREIIFASSGPDFADAARRKTLKFNELISRYR